MTIRFPMTRERTGRRTGPRYRRVVDSSQLCGARKLSALMVSGAMRYRDEQQPSYLSPGYRTTAVRMARLGMRAHALWARVWAGQIDQTDPRIDAVTAERSRLVREFCAEGRSA